MKIHEKYCCLIFVMALNDFRVLEVRFSLMLLISAYENLYFVQLGLGGLEVQCCTMHQRMFLMVLMLMLGEQECDSRGASKTQAGREDETSQGGDVGGSTTPKIT